MPKEFFHYRPMEAFCSPSDAVAGPKVEPQTSRIYHHKNIYGELTFNAHTGDAVSPLLPQDAQRVSLLKRASPPELTIPGKILELLMKNPTKVLGWNDLAKTVWNIDYKLDNHDTVGLQFNINLLRKILGEETDRKHGREAKKIIHTIPRRGITMADSAELISESNPKAETYIIPAGKILVNYDALLITSPGVNEGTSPIALTPTEIDLLLAFAQHPEGKLPSTFKWDSPGSMRTYINSLRGKLKKPDLIKTLAGAYQMLIEKAA